MTKRKTEGLRSSVQAVPALPAPPSKEARGVSSSGALPSLTPVSREVAALKGLPLAGVKKKRKQRENPRPAGVTSLPVIVPSQERRVKQRHDPTATISASRSSSCDDILKVYLDLLILFSCCFSYSFLLSSQL